MPLKCAGFTFFKEFDMILGVEKREKEKGILRKGKTDMYVFISHSSNEANIAGELCEVLENSGNSCFVAPRDIRLGHEYAEEIVNGIDRADAMLLLLSKAANQSPHVLREVERAVTKSIPVLVYKVEEVELTKSMEYFLMTHQWMIAGKNTYEDVVKCIEGMGRGNPSHGEVPEKTSNRKNKKKAGVIGLCACAVLLLLGLLGVYLIKGDGKEPLADLHLGDTLVFGSYQDEDIYWRVLKLSEDGTEAVIVSRDVLTVKAFDGADSGEYNHDGTKNYYFSEESATLDAKTAAYVKGNNTWATSSIRTWLNSDMENVKYEGTPPVSAAMADGRNGYSGEKGFLCSFSEEELEMIKTTSVETKGTLLSEQEVEMTEDKVFLLSMEELEWFEAADVSLLAAPTDAAIEKNETYWYRDYCLGFGVETMMWWLREPVEGSSTQCYLIGNGYHEENIYTWEVGVESFGIRPAMTIDLTGEKVFTLVE